MTLEEFVKTTHKDDRYLVRPVIICVDGFKMSVQGSEFHYCEPRELVQKYDRMEIGYPSEYEEELMPYVEDEGRPTDTVYGYVPCGVIESVIKKHGGIDVEKTLNK